MPLVISLQGMLSKTVGLMTVHQSEQTFQSKLCSSYTSLSSCFPKASLYETIDVDPKQKNKTKQNKNKNKKIKDKILYISQALL